MAYLRFLRYWLSHLQLTPFRRTVSPGITRHAKKLPLFLRFLTCIMPAYPNLAGRNTGSPGRTNEALRPEIPYA
jgi:hypothetical protein